MKTKIGLAMGIAMVFALLAFQSAPVVAKGDDMVEVVKILNDSLTRGHAGFYVDGRIIGQDEAEAIPEARILTTTILYGGRPYIDEFIRRILAATPKLPEEQQVPPIPAGK